MTNYTNGTHKANGTIKTNRTHRTNGTNRTHGTNKPKEQVGQIVQIEHIERIGQTRYL